ncbi:MAG: sensor domain-containing diguanylate cyclase [Undibacterium sp.]|uniref:sensor domain-containing diguanylate cyclase n=1 Tax=Undibacterium sp. TaxID=1914977 RepID=UPI00271E47B2|nr:sensor domain-containing diguanylate cyclase [Undibacterium sp.]MDO8651715.1 sensor domain-containing diguanylate cyclase [Undibacterium sp.]
MPPDSFYHSLFDIMPVAVAIIIDGKFVYANATAMSLLEANSSEQVIGQAVAEFVHPLDHTRSHNRLSKTGFEWSNAPSQFRLRAVSGSLKMILASSVPMSYEGRDAILLTGMNMTEQAEMAEQLRVSEQNFRSLFENMQDVYYRTDAKGIVQMVGPGVRSVLGFEPQEIEGKTAESYYPQTSDRDLMKKAIMKNGKVADFPGQMVRKDGRIIDISISSRALYDDSGAFAGIEGIYRDVTQRKMMERELQRLATTDPLTNIANRRAFLEQADLIFKSSQRYLSSMNMLMLDLDFFKAINDKYGHLGGDKVLTRFAQTVALELRDSDLFGRIGGEEFCILLQQSNQQEAMNVAERIRERVHSLFLKNTEGESFTLTVSIGMTTNLASDERLGRLFERADKALYEAKNSGRNRVVWRV